MTVEPGTIERLQAGLNHIRRYGWVTKKTYDVVTGRTCAVGAIVYGCVTVAAVREHDWSTQLAALGPGGLPSYHGAIYYLHRALAARGSSVVITTWNDRVARNQAEVEALFEEAILIAQHDLASPVHENAPETALAASGA